jgi:hypothetical protein
MVKSYMQMIVHSIGIMPGHNKILPLWAQKAHGVKNSSRKTKPDNHDNIGDRLSVFAGIFFALRKTRCEV